MHSFPFKSERERDLIYRVGTYRCAREKTPLETLRHSPEVKRLGRLPELALVIVIWHRWPGYPRRMCEEGGEGQTTKDRSR